MSISKNIVLGSLLIAATTASSFTQGSSARVAGKPSGTFKISVREYTDKVQAIWAGQIIGAQIGLKYENSERAVRWVDSLPGSWKYAPLDDDYYYEMVTLKAFEHFGVHMTIEQLGAQWLKDSCGVWGSTKLAKWAMLKGIKPPESGNPFNNKSYNTIGPQFTSDIYGALTPGRPNLAGKLARYYGHINGFAEGTDGAVFVAGMISAAFNEHDPKRIVEKAAGLIGLKSPYRQCLEMVISSARKGLSAQDIFDQIEDKWRVDYPANNNAVANGGIVATCVWFGKGDFLTTLNLACSAADYSDADCNAANSSSVICAMHGLKAIPLYLLNALGNRIKGDMIGPGHIPAVDETITSLAERTAAMGIAIMKDNGTPVSHGFLNITEQKIITQPAEIFELNELVKHWNGDWKIKNALRSSYIENGYLVTLPRLAPLGSYLYREADIKDKDTLKLVISAEPGKCWELKVLVDNDKIFTKIIESNTAQGKWQTIAIDLSKYRGRSIMLRLFQNNLVEGRYTGSAYWKSVTLN